MKISLVLLLFTAVLASAQTGSNLPPRLDQLQRNYEAAVQRVTAPLTVTYIDELRKAKNDYLKTGDLEGAQAANALLDAALASRSSADLSSMTEGGFKLWLGKVKIIEQESPFKMVFTFDDAVIHSFRPDRPGLRAHRNATIEVGKIIVPFTDTQATIKILPSMTEASISYSAEGKTYKAVITPK